MNDPTNNTIYNQTVILTEHPTNNPTSNPNK